MESRFMTRAIQLARLAASEGEVPVGAVVVKDKRILAGGRYEKKNYTVTFHVQVWNEVTNRYEYSQDVYTPITAPYNSTIVLPNGRIEGTNEFISAFENSSRIPLFLRRI